LWGTLFVNDCDLLTTAVDPSNIYQELADHMQEGMSNTLGGLD
jgi:hypothetical protein